MSELGVVIVNYNSADYLRGCLASLYQETACDFHVVVVDNDSRDQDRLPELTSGRRNLSLILNQFNLGFSRGCNQGIRLRKANNYLLLNPDCVIVDEAVDKTLQYLVRHPEIGIVGCRVENPDGTLQRACRRATPTPSTAFYRLSGLSSLFPASRRFAGYHFGHLDPADSHPVEAVSGSFLMFRSEAHRTIGPLDERFFLYGEDLDFCLRARRQGWDVQYFSGARIIHHKRVSSSRRPQESSSHFFEAMEIFYEKHFSGKAGSIERSLVPVGIHLLRFADRIGGMVTGRHSVGSKG